jgi:Copper transport outer membrane protein, MctB
MINFRFHLVSLIAVFLALGLGILVGSTVVDQVIVDRLDTEIKNVRHDSNVANAQSTQLKNELAQSNDFLKRSAEFLVQDRLQDVPVAIVADKGVDGGSVRALLTMLRDAGAISPGILWLDDAWKLESSKDLDALHRVTNTEGTDAATRAVALEEIVHRFSGPVATTRRGAKPPPDILETLRTAGFIDFTDGNSSALAKFPTRAARVLEVTGTDSHLLASGMPSVLAQSLAGAHVPAVVAEVYDDHNQAPSAPARGSSLAAIRGDANLASQVSTLDDGETLAGETTAVLALEQIANGTVGHYGYGQGARRPLPLPPS